jgi:anti-sigma regulatory factor (Ser/Thr protein kinase)
MDLKGLILSEALKAGKITSQEIAIKFGISRQYAQRILRELVQKGLLIKLGSTRAASYVLPKYAGSVEWKFDKRFSNENLAEHEVLEYIEGRAQFRQSLSENVRSVFEYAFSEMLNNAIEHSQSQNIQINVEKNENNLQFQINDFGIGVFRNIMSDRGLKSELEAVQDLLKGKTTTQPQAHSGEGIFFTSKVADVFSLESFGYKLTVDNNADDIFFEEVKPSKRGTKVIFYITCDSERHLNDLFAEYQTDPEEHAFDKTEVQIKLYTMGTIHISRSQARRVLAGLEKFKSIILDFDNVPNVGQAFADEIFRVFKKKHPDIQITPINMNQAVRFMIERVGD